jgi:hypothetical protein
MQVNSVEEAHAQGYDLYHYVKATESAKQRKSFETLGMGYDCVEFVVEYTSHMFRVCYLGVRRTGQLTRKERGL